ncbi:Lipid A core-O-antigen ligase-like enyme [Hyella patelloides LEGE 07179]|uniref:Lipid A core-O-antigen ligase-like enyme n=1 Tax=Hyella patelloides LEGE 07179 TaxID=945734 RepID=A0A563VSD1_9CYAN|nr:O-antigen ligase family protein [Hyella patelloides]VEP14360.1 Lipid A core-O-antigen ligase-like enyme [Hyella patelloides LEGE 07179]
MLNTPSSLFKNFEAIFVRLSLFHMSSALFPLILSGGASEGDGVDINTVDLSLIAKINLLIYFVACVLLVLRWKKVLIFASKNIFFWPFVIFASFSYFWSSMPDDTFRGVVYGLGTTAFGIYFASRYNLKEQLNHLAWTLGSILGLSTLFAIAIPHYGIMAGVHEGAVRGIYTHKNVFSPIIVLSVVVFFLQAIDAQEKKWLQWGLFVLSIAFGIMSRSSTALGLMVVMLFLCLSYRVFRWRYEILVSAILLILIVGSGGLLWFVEFGGAELLFDTLGKDATLSSRTEIWAYVWDSIQLKPLLGYGLNGYWHGLDGPSAYVQRAMRVRVHYAHNGFLDICVNFGFIGFTLFIANLLLVISKSLSLLRKSNAVAGFWPLLWLTYLILTNLTEGSLSSLNTMTWALYTTVSFSLAAIRENKREINFQRASI